jgi:hypothetical protein
MDCSICLENFDNQTMVMCNTQTHNHGFCQNCYDDWCTTCTQNHNNITCPICQLCWLPLGAQSCSASGHILISTYIHNNDNNNHIDNDISEEDDYIYEENSVYESIEEKNNNYYTYENNIFIEYYDAEKIEKAFEVTKINNKFDGFGITYWKNGNIMRISNYINDKKYGNEKEYNSNGILYSIQYIYQDHYHGSRKVFNQDGSINRIESYINGNLINNDFLEEIKNRN